jgi:hypothetical protein
MADGGTPDKQIIIQYLVKANEALAETEKFRLQVEAVKKQIRDLAESSKSSFKDIAEGMKRALASQQKLGPVSGISNAVQYNKALSTALQEVQKESGQTGKAFMGMGDIAKYVFGTILGLSAIQILRQVVQWLGQAAQSGYEFTKAIFQLGIAVNALRRSGIDITFNEITENLERLRQKFKIFSTKELVEGSAAFFNLNRDLGLTKDQLFEMQDAVATLAIVNGRAMDDVQRTVALALSSGYTEGLQRLGVSINRVNITQEAMRIGFKGSYLALTEQERALATYNLLVQKTAKYADDLTQYYKTLPGAIDSATATIEDQKRAIGENLQVVTLLVKLVQQAYLAYVSFTNPILLIIKNIKELRTRFEAFYAVLYENYPIFHTMEKVFITLGRKFENVVNKMHSNWYLFIKGIKEGIRDIPFLEQSFKLLEAYEKKLEELKKKQEIGLVPAEDDEKVVEAAQKFVDEWKDIQENAEDSREKSHLDYLRDIERMDRDAARDRLEIEYDLQNDLLEVRVKAGHDAYDLYLKYQFDLAQLSTDTQDKIADAQRKYRQKELEAERDYQEKLRRLREDFLFDLEDALRERDALQVIRLTRRYNLEKARLEREKNNEDQTRQEQYQNELKDIQAQRAAREAELRKEFEFRLAEIQREMFREIAAKEAQAAIERDQLERNLKAQKEERDLQYAQQLSDIDAQVIASRDKLIAAIDEEYKLTKGGIDQLKQLIEDELGANSAITATLKALYDRAAATFNQLRLTMEYANSVGLEKSNTNQIEKNTGTGFATGGMAVVKQPTMISVGEKEAEVLSVAPLSKLRRMLSVPTSRQGGTGRDGRIAVELLLSPDLQARIVDNTLDQMSDVFVTIQGSRPQ